MFCYGDRCVYSMIVPRLGEVAFLEVRFARVCGFRLKTPVRGLTSVHLVRTPKLQFFPVFGSDPTTRVIDSLGREVHINRTLSRMFLFKGMGNLAK